MHTAFGVEEEKKVMSTNTPHHQNLVSSINLTRNKNMKKKEQTVEGSVLALLRAKVGKSQLELAQILDTSQHKISRIEIGRQDLPKEWLDQLIEHFSISPEWVRANVKSESEDRDYEMQILRQEVDNLRQRVEDKEQIIGILKGTLEQLTDKKTDPQGDENHQ